MSAANAPGYIDDKDALAGGSRGSRDRCGGCGGWSTDEAYCVDVLTQIAAVERRSTGWR